MEKADLVLTFLGEGNSGGGKTVSGMSDGGSGVTGMSVSGGDGNGGGLRVVEGLDNGLVDVCGGSNWSNDGLLGKDGLFPEDGLGSIVGVLNGCWLDMGNWCWLMNVGGLSNRVGDGGKLWGDLGEGLGGDDSIGKVASQSVALNGGAVMLRCTHDVRGGGNGTSGQGGGNEACVGNSQKASKNNEALEKRQIEND